MHDVLDDLIASFYLVDRALRHRLPGISGRRTLWLRFYDDSFYS
jgi:hypothetical protein